MTKKQAVEEFSKILYDTLKEYGHDHDSIRKEIWDMFLDELKVSGKINTRQRQNWVFPREFKKKKTNYLVYNNII